jgi:hypothetical protein
MEMVILLLMVVMILTTTQINTTIIKTGIPKTPVIMEVKVGILTTTITMRKMVEREVITKTIQLHPQTKALSTRMPNTQVKSSRKKKPIIKEAARIKSQLL